MKTVSADTLRKLGRDALTKVGVREDIITPVIEGLVWTSLRGIDTHGIRLLPHYIESVKGGRLNPNPDCVSNKPLLPLACWMPTTPSVTPPA